MKILFTGASSFTGMWFIKELASQGHEITCIFPRAKEAYQGIRKNRLDAVLPRCEPLFSCTFGSDPFLELVESKPWDILCHHAAEVNHYKSPDFDVVSAVEKNTFRLPDVFDRLKEKGCRKVLLTGSVFEQNEGEGDNIDQPVSPYGMSKGLTAEIFRYACEQYQFSLGKFVISNPFGPYEEERFTTYLAKNWLAGNVPEVSHPDYVRDNIHVSLLAKLYARSLEALNNASGYMQWNPSGYCESQGEFTRRFSNEMEKRLSVPCKFTLAVQNDFPEPKTRINTQPVNKEGLGWREKDAWDQLASFYRAYYG